MSLNREIIKNFSSKLRGQVILPSDVEYNDARKIWNAMHDKKPLMIVRPVSAVDVILCAQFAKEHKIFTAIKGGGHSIAGYGVCSDGMVIDFSMMKGIKLSLSDKKVRVEPGVTWAELDRETQAFGFAVPGGIISSTGVAGLTLGGGIGWLVRKYGLTIDNLISVDLVTLNGELLTVSEKQNADLFWGIKGGGSNFGIVTSFEFKLHQVGPLILGGMIGFLLEDSKQVLQAYRKFISKSPQELTTLVAFLSAPKDPLIPSKYLGQKIIFIPFCYIGKYEKGQKLIAAIKKFAKPIFHEVKRMPFTAVQKMLDDGSLPYRRNYWGSRYFNGLSDEIIDTIVSYFSKVPSSLSAIYLHHIGDSVVQKINKNKSSFHRRDADFVINMMSIWTNPKEDKIQKEWVKNFQKDLQKYVLEGVYINFLGKDEKSREKDFVDESKKKRLVALKRKYDPKNLLRFNHNIVP